jgi:hypothetical protein
MKDCIDKLKEIETLVELSIGTTMTEQKATDIYAITNDLMCKVKKLNKPVVSGQVCKCGNDLTDKEIFYKTCLKCDAEV